MGAPALGQRAGVAIRDRTWLGASDLSKNTSCTFGLNDTEHRVEAEDKVELLLRTEPIVRALSFRRISPMKPIDDLLLVDTIRSSNSSASSLYRLLEDFPNMGKHPEGIASTRRGCWLVMYVRPNEAESYEQDAS